MAEKCLIDDASARYGGNVVSPSQAVAENGPLYQVGAELSNASRRARPRLVIVVPCYNEALVVRETICRLTNILKSLVINGIADQESYLYLVDDGSTDDTWRIICELHATNKFIKALKLSRNFGHQNALLAGMSSVRAAADCVITMDADLQHDENAIYTFLESYKKGADIVYGVRKTSGKESYFKRLSSLLFYRLMRLLGARTVNDHPDYRLVSAQVLGALADYREVNLFLRGIFSEIGFRSEVVFFDVHERHAGVSHYSFARRLSLALDGITSFSVVPLRLIGLAGALIMFGSICSGAFVVISALRRQVVPGWASTVLPIYLLGGLQIFMVGILAEYVGKVYSEVKERPRFIKEQELA